MSIITWKDVAKLAIGIAIGLTSTLYIMECNGNENVQTNNVAKVNHYQNRYTSISTKETLVISGEEADDYNLFGHDSIGIYKKDEKFGYYNNRTKEIVIPAIYENAWRFSEGLAGVIKEGKLGFINLKGETIIDFNHAYHESRLYEFTFRWGYCTVPDDKGRCGVIDKKGNWVIQPRYEHANYSCTNNKKTFTGDVEYIDEEMLSMEDNWTLSVGDYANSVKGHKEVDVICGTFLIGRTDTLHLEDETQTEYTFDVVSSNPNIPVLKLENTLCPLLVNEGDLDGNGTTEVGILDTWHTSSCRLYRIYTLKPVGGVTIMHI